MAETSRITKLTPADRTFLLSKTTFTLPDNPSDKEFNAKTIKEKGYAGVLVVFQWLSRLAKETSDIVSDFENFEKISLRAVEVEGSDTIKKLYDLYGGHYMSIRYNRSCYFIRITKHSDDDNYDLGGTIITKTSMSYIGLSDIVPTTTVASIVNNPSNFKELATTDYALHKTGDTMSGDINFVAGKGINANGTKYLTNGIVLGTYTLLHPLLTANETIATREWLIGVDKVISAQITFNKNPKTKNERTFSDSHEYVDKGYVDSFVGTTGSVTNRIAAEEEARANGDNALDERISDVEDVIPEQASTENELADKNFVNSTVNSLAAFYITSNAEGDPFPSLAALEAATQFYYAGSLRTPTKNDYCLVNGDETHDNASVRYLFVGTYGVDGHWQYQFVVNETPLTAAQLAAVNSGITSVLVGQITTNKNDIISLNAAKLSKTEANGTYQKIIPPVDITINPEDWEEMVFEDEPIIGYQVDIRNVTGVGDFAQGSVLVLGGSYKDGIVKSNSGIELIDITNTEGISTIATFRCFMEVPTQAVTIRLEIIKR